MKRNLLVLTLLAFCATMCLSFFAVAPANVYAQENTVNKVTGYEYQLSYLVESAGLEYKSTYTATIGGVKVVKPSTEEGGVSADTQKEAGFITDGSKVEFLDKKDYTLTVLDGENTVGEFVVNTQGMPLTGSLAYNYSLEQLQAYTEKVEEATMIPEEGTDEPRPIRVDDDYSVPSIASLVKDDYFDVDNLTGTLYYAVPGSTSYSSKSITDLDHVNFEVTKVGTYSFYLVLRNNIVAMSTTDLVMGEGGWHEKNDDGEPVGDVLIPVFTFNVGASSSPKVTVGTSEKAYKGLEYKVDCFNIVASDYNTQYTLYYSETKVAQENITSYDQNSLEALGLQLVSEENGFESKNLLNEGTRTFTPVKKGYYYVVLHVVDFANEHTTAISRAIDATNELRQVSYESEFFKYNAVSIVLFSISVVCFVAIIVLLCVKPKDKDTLTTKK